ncbi:MAG: hypothetical protein JW920_02165 [Deltaproteobacteria bacterium]|nr:hypothetical protein [Deltaproteobacteria bacterium]
MLGNTELVVFGIGDIQNGNLAQAEQAALDDAFGKAFFIMSLRYVPESAIPALIQRLPAYAAIRSMQDISQYKIVSRSQQYDILRLTVSLVINNEALQEWLYSQTLTIPRKQRPKILLMISSHGPGNHETYEWWNRAGKRNYSPFESQFVRGLNEWGENVFENPPRLKNMIFGPMDPFSIAGNFGADFVLTGSISYTPVLEELYECVFDISLLDVKKGSSAGAWTISHRGDIAINEMNSLMIDNAMNLIQPHIAHIILSTSPIYMTKTMCIKGINNYITYQTIINSLYTMDSVSDIGIESIKEHTICHTMKIRGSLEDAMENLRREQIIEMDIDVQDDGAVVTILNQ